MIIWTLSRDMKAEINFVLFMLPYTTDAAADGEILDLQNFHLVKF